MKKDAEAARFGVEMGEMSSDEQMPWNGDNPSSDSSHTELFGRVVGAMK